jgi:hypothetical protein
MLQDVYQVLSNFYNKDKDEFYGFVIIGALIFLSLFFVPFFI